MKPVVFAHRATSGTILLLSKDFGDWTLVWSTGRHLLVPETTFCTKVALNKKSLLAHLYQIDLPEKVETIILFSPADFVCVPIETREALENFFSPIIFPVGDPIFVNVNKIKGTFPIEHGGKIDLFTHTSYCVLEEKSLELCKQRFRELARLPTTKDKTIFSNWKNFDTTTEVVILNHTLEQPPLENMKLQAYYCISQRERYYVLCQAEPEDHTMVSLLGDARRNIKSSTRLLMIIGIYLKVVLAVLNLNAK